MMGKPIRLVYDEKTKKFELREVEWIYHVGTLVPGLGLPMMLWEGIRYIVDRFNSPGNLTQDDAENIRKIIEEGRNQKVDEMEIEMSRNVTTGFSIDGIKGAEITLGSKGETKYVMKVKYKYDE
ncbi:MAG: hypothetical protein KME42_12955 [Tildeniella nuda ZEHNDER 1965/U140]|jgi:hypothetical protein|nr:hypothetical protein [Tildeniella nuda ZEHNDER 1965/U140]